MDIGRNFEMRLFFLECYSFLYFLKLKDPAPSKMSLLNSPPRPDTGGCRLAASNGRESEAFL